MRKTLYDKVLDATEFIKDRIKDIVDIGLVLGSGLGDISEVVNEKVVIPFSEIPYFPESTVKGHFGNLVFGKLNDKKLLFMQGRFHYYEGYDLKEATLPVRVIKKLGASVVIFTNAAGGISKNLSVGDIMIIEDHINFILGDNPLRGENDERLGSKFVDMYFAYDKEFIKTIEKVAKNKRIEIKKGIYAAVSGPNYETMAEIKMLSKLGADAVGMSTVPETIVARQENLRVLGISCITDIISDEIEPLTHEKVLEEAKKTNIKVTELIRGFIEEL